MWRLLGWSARRRRSSLASPLAAALGMYFFSLFIHTFWRLQRLSDPLVCGHTSCSLCALSFVVCTFVVAVVRSPMACGSLPSVTCGCPSYHASFCAGSLQYIEYSMHRWALGRRRCARGGGWFGGGLFIPWRACGGSLGVCVHGHTSCVCSMVFHGFPVFSCGALRFGGLFPLTL